MKPRRRRNARGQEAGQVLPMFVMFLSMMVGIVGLAVDIGRAYIEKAELSRSLDAAALAGATDLPDTAKADASARKYLTINMPRATYLTPTIDVPNQKVTIRASSSVKTIFIRILGIGKVDVSAEAQAGASNIGDSSLPLDVTVLLDDTGTMRSGCTDTQVTTVGANQSSPVCPIGLTRNAAKDFVDVLAQGGALPPATKIGYLSFRACYAATTNINPRNEPAPPVWNPLRGCTKLTDTIGLSNSVPAIKTAINTMRGAGGYPGTNLCLGLARGDKVLFGAGAQAGARKVLIILTDGENRYSDFAYQDVGVADSLPSANRHLANPAPNTYPTGLSDTMAAPPADSDPNIDSCYPAGSTFNQDATAYGADYDRRINYLDVHTVRQADLLKAQNTEIFVVGFGVDGNRPRYDVQCGNARATRDVHRARPRGWRRSDAGRPRGGKVHRVLEGRHERSLLRSQCDGALQRLHVDREADLVPVVEVMRAHRMTKRLGSTNGQTLAEFAIIAPLFLLMMFMIVDFSRMIQSYTTIQHGAREGARYAVTGRSDCALTTPTRLACVKDVAARSASKLTGGAPALNVSVRSWAFQAGGYSATPTANDAGKQCDDMEVKISYDYKPITPLISRFIGTVPLTATERLVNEPYGACAAG